MDKQKQIEEMVNLDIEQSVSGYSAFINDMRISKAKPLSVSKTIISLDCPKKYIYEAIGIPEGALVITKEYYESEAYARLIENELCKKCRERVAEAYEMIRKETAEKIAEMADDKSVYFNIDGKIYKAVHFEDIAEICKEITEGKV